MRPAVIIVTHWFDPTADFVVEELNRRAVPLLRFDTADFPQRLMLNATLNSGRWDGALRLGDRSVALGDVGGIYFRRPTLFDFGALPEPISEWALAEARNGLSGLLMASNKWLNHPHHNGYADFKPIQLTAACRAGLAVPRTIITNDPAQARGFVKELGDVIYKPMSPAVLPDGAAKGSMLYASPVKPHDLQESNGVAATAHMFQERIKHDYAVRLTVVDDRAFAAAIHAHSDAAAIDWRSDYDALTYETIDVPADVYHGVMKLMTALHLRFGAFDFLVTPDRGWIFLEVNPNGQWAWIEQTVGLPISSAIADALTKQETK